MPAKGNQFKTNTLRDDTKPDRSSSKSEKEKPSKPKQERQPVFNPGDGRLAKILGLFLLILSVFFLIAFTSYLFTWQEDQSYVATANGGWHNLFKTQQELIDNGIKNPVVENWLGKFGALLSNQFIFEWFGVASFLFVFVFFIVGYRLLFRVRLYPVSKTLGYSFFLLIFVSVTLGFFHAFISNVPHFLEGNFGFWSNRLLDAQIGEAGTAGILVFAALTVLIIAYNIDFKIPARKKGELNEDIVGEVAPQVVEIEDEYPSKPIEWPKNGNRVKDETVLENAVFHEPMVLTPDPLAKHEPELEDEIPLTIDTVRPTGELSIEQVDDDKAKKLVEEFGTFDPKLDLASYKYPTLDLLENYGSNKINVNAEELEANKNKIVETLNHYNIDIDKIKATIGPTVTLYEIIPAPGVRISKIKNLEDDIALSLAALGIRIIAPMPGKGTIGIEVP
ncbi:MAG: DNA translocase FtsK 4TM domain-containing protein, partial [Mucilaginibacter sp.]